MELWGYFIYHVFFLFTFIELNICGTIKLRLQLHFYPFQFFLFCRNSTSSDDNRRASRPGLLLPEPRRRNLVERRRRIHLATPCRRDAGSRPCNICLVNTNNVLFKHLCIKKSVTFKTTLKQGVIYVMSSNRETALHFFFFFWLCFVIFWNST